MSEKTILIQGAMSVETKLLIDALSDAEKIVLNGYEFYKGKINDCAVVISITKVGMINASVATILGINHFNPKCIINQGVAGGHDKKVHKGDIIIGEFAANMNSFKTCSKKEDEGSNPFEWELITFNEGKDVLKEKIPANIELVEKSSNVFEMRNFKIHKGTIVSGDVWNKECDRINWFVSELNSLCEDMETFAVYKVCQNNDVPVLGIRMISNSEINNESYDRNLANVLQEKIIEMLCTE